MDCQHQPKEGKVAKATMPMIILKRKDEKKKMTNGKKKEWEEEGKTLKILDKASWRNDATMTIEKKSGSNFENSSIVKKNFFKPAENHRRVNEKSIEQSRRHEQSNRKKADANRVSCLSRSLSHVEKAKIDTRMVKFINELNYVITQVNGQRKLGPPPGWLGPPPNPCCEIFVGKIPKTLYEPDIYPLFQSIGEIYEMRLMMDFCGMNRGYCFIMYTNPQYAKLAVKKLNNYEISPGRKIGVVMSINNRRLFVTQLPHHIDTKTITRRIFGVTDEVDNVAVYRHFSHVISCAFITYKTHRGAAMARRKLILEASLIFPGAQLNIGWANPSMSPSNVLEERGICDEMGNVRIMVTCIPSMTEQDCLSNKERERNEKIDSSMRNSTELDDVQKNAKTENASSKCSNRSKNSVMVLPHRSDESLVKNREYSETPLDFNEQSCQLLTDQNPNENKENYGTAGISNFQNTYDSLKTIWDNESCYAQSSNQNHFGQTATNNAENLKIDETDKPLRSVHFNNSSQVDVSVSNPVEPRSLEFSKMLNLQSGYNMNSNLLPTLPVDSKNKHFHAVGNNYPHQSQHMYQPLMIFQRKPEFTNSSTPAATSWIVDNGTMVDFNNGYFQNSQIYARPSIDEATFYASRIDDQLMDVMALMNHISIENSSAKRPILQERNYQQQQFYSKSQTNSIDAMPFPVNHQQTQHSLIFYSPYPAPHLQNCTKIGCNSINERYNQLNGFNNVPTFHNSCDLQDAGRANQENNVDNDVCSTQQVNHCHQGQQAIVDTVSRHSVSTASNFISSQNQLTSMNLDNNVYTNNNELCTNDRNVYRIPRPILRRASDGKMNNN